MGNRIRKKPHKRPKRKILNTQVFSLSKTNGLNQSSISSPASSTPKDEEDTDLHTNGNPIAPSKIYILIDLYIIYILL